MSSAIYSYILTTLVGLNYSWGGSTVNEGFDCSGLQIHIMEREGRWERSWGDATSQGIYQRLKDEGYVETKLPKAGYNVFYGKSVKKITHVAYYIGDGLIVEAGGGDSETLTLNDAIREHAWVRINPIGYRKDLIAILAKRVR